MTAFNPHDRDPDIELSSDCLTAINTNHQVFGAVRTDLSHNKGKWYFEARADRFIEAANVGVIGLAKGTADLNYRLGGDAVTLDPETEWSAALYCHGVVWADNVGQFINLPVSIGETAGLAVDFDAGKAWVRDATGWVGDPVLGTGHSISFPPRSLLYAACHLWAKDDQVTANFGSKTFVYNVPFGFRPWRVNTQRMPVPEDYDRHVRRDGDAYAEAFLTLLPQGQAWPKWPGSTLERACNGLSQIWGFADDRAADLLERESDPRHTYELLPDWERAWGLPDPCFPEAKTIGERQRMLVLYMTWKGSQSRAYFTWLMEWLGFTVTVKEYAPFMAGVSRVGDTRPNPKDNFRWYIGPPEMRFAWSVGVGTPAFIWFRAGSGQAGVDPHLQIGIPDDLQCLLNRWKPAHTDLVFDYGQLAFGGPMQGTP